MRKSSRACPRAVPLKNTAIIKIASREAALVDVLIRGVPEETMAALKRRARNRSLQGELRGLLISSAGQGQVDGAALARRVRKRIEEERGSALDGDSTEIARADRDSR